LPTTGGPGYTFHGCWWWFLPADEQKVRTKVAVKCATTATRHFTFTIVSYQSNMNERFYPGEPSLDYVNLHTYLNIDGYHLGAFLFC
jgi:hypothetical protein